MTLLPRPLVDSLLGKAKVGGIVLAAVVVGTGTAQALAAHPSARPAHPVSKAAAATPGKPATKPATKPSTTSGDTTTIDPAQACQDARSHGAYVRWVARTTARGPGHAAAVRAAARSDCGKPDPAPTHDDATGTDDDVTPTTVTDDATGSDDDATDPDHPCDGTGKHRHHGWGDPAAHHDHAGWGDPAAHDHDHGPGHEHGGDHDHGSRW